MNFYLLMYFILFEMINTERNKDLRNKDFVRLKNEGKVQPKG